MGFGNAGIGGVERQLLLLGGALREIDTVFACHGAPPCPDGAS